MGFKDLIEIVAALRMKQCIDNPQITCRSVNKYKIVESLLQTFMLVRRKWRSCWVISNCLGRTVLTRVRAGLNPLVVDEIHNGSTARAP